MKKLLLSGVLVLAHLLPLGAVAGPPSIIVVRIYDYGLSTKAIITRGEGQSEVVEVDTKGNFTKQLTQSSEGYYKLFQRFYQDGYALQSTISTSASNGAGYITLLFTKAQ